MKTYLSKKEEEQEPKEPGSEKEHDPWYDYHVENNEKLLNETIVTLRLTKKHYKTALYTCSFTWT